MKRADRWVCAGLGLLVGLLMALMGKSASAWGTQAPLLRSQDLAARVKRLSADNEALFARVAELESQVKSYEDAQSNEDEMARQMEAELTALRMEAGLVAVRGPGVIIRLDNLTTEYGVSFIQDEDILTILNELNASGAEALSINGERMIATTEVRTAGRYVSINTRPYNPPYEIRAIGNAQTLNAAMYLYGGVVERLSQWMQISVEMSDEIEIPAYNGVKNNQYAQEDAS